MLHIIDIYSEPGIHDRVNKSFFDAIKLYESEKVLFWGHKQIGELYDFNTISLARKSSTKKSLKYIVRDLLVPLFLIFALPFKIKKNDRVVVTGFSRPQIISFSFLILLISKFVPVGVLFHSQVEVINQSQAQGILRFYQNTLRIMMINLLQNSSLRCLVLSDHIRKNIEISVPNCKSIRSISHPFTLDDLNSVQEIERNLELKNSSDKIVGAFGLFRDDTKKSSQLYDIASVNMDYKFRLVGRKGPGFHWQEGYTNVENIQLQGIVSQEKANEYINSFDYLIYSYPSDSYKYTASGSVLDGMISCKGIIVSENDSLHEAVKGYPELYSLTKDMLICPSTQPDSFESYTDFICSRVIAPNNENIFDVFCWFLWSKS